MTKIETVLELAKELEFRAADKPAVHDIAKRLTVLLALVVKESRPGLGEFKWSAAKRKALTIPSNASKGLPKLILTDCAGDDQWHSDGHYAVNAPPSARFEPYERQVMESHRIASLIPQYTGDVVTVVCSRKSNGVDCVEMSNGAVVNDLYLSYVTATLGGDVEYRSNGKLVPLLVLVGGVVRGLVMPINTGEGK